MTRHGKRIRIVNLRKPDLPAVEVGSIRLGIVWLKANGFKPYTASQLSDYFRFHPDRCCYIPDHRDYLLVMLEN